MSSYLDGNRPADAPLSGFLASPGEREDKLIAGTAPVLDVKSRDFSGTLWSMPLRTLLGDGEYVGSGKLKRAPNAKFPRPFNDFQMTETSYKCEERSLADFIDRVTRNRWAGPLAAEIVRAKSARMTLLLNFEAEVIGSTVFNTGNWPDVAIGGLGGRSAQLAWTAAGSTPKIDGRRLRDLVRTATGGIFPDYGYVTYAAVEACTSHPDFTGHRGTLAQGLAQGPAVVSQNEVVEQMRAAWQLDELHVVEAMYNSANPGQTLSVAEIETGGQLWLGCKRGMVGAAGSPDGLAGGAQLGAGPVSFVVLREDLAAAMPETMGVVPRGGFFGMRWETNDPPGTDMAAGHSFAVCIPTDMVNTACLLTGLV